jgi:predicted phage-related endonuclease
MSASLHPDRALVVTSSNAAAMMGVDAYRSPYALWAQMTGVDTGEDFDGNDPVFWGTVLEPAVEEGVRLRTGWDIRRCQKFIRYSAGPEPLGATPDCLIVTRQQDGTPAPYAEWGVLEIKTCDAFAWNNWAKPEQGGILEMQQDAVGTWTWRRPRREPPAAYQVQLQVQLACTGLSWGVIAVLVGGNRLELYHYNRHDGAIQAIAAKAVEFMRMVEDRQSPPIDWSMDGDAIRRIYAGAEPGKVIAGDEELEALALRYEELGAAAREIEKERDILSPRILATMGDAVEATLPGGKRITAPVIGETVVESYVRKSYRPVQVREARAEKRKRRH